MQRAHACTEARIGNPADEIENCIERGKGCPAVRVLVLVDLQHPASL